MENKKHEEYNNHLNFLKEKSKTSIRITKNDNSFKSLGEYVEEYPEIHVVELFEDKNNTVYRLDKK